MKAIIFSFLFIFVVQNCKKQDDSLETESWQKISGRVSYLDQQEKLLVKSGKATYSFNKEELPLKRTVFLNASLIGFAAALGLENKVVGVSSPEYIFSEKIHKLLQDGKIADVGNEQKYDLEKIIALKPDAVFTNYIAGFENTYQLLRNNGIKIIFLDEYLEQKPLEKSAYLLLFGKLFNREKIALKIFSEIKGNYEMLTGLAKKAPFQPLVLANEMYGNQWFLPAGTSQLAYYLKDANGNYIGKENSGSQAVPLSFEEVFVKAKDATIWVNAGNHPTKKDMLTLNSAYAKMNVFNKGKIYAVTGREKNKANDFFESGVVRADLVLQDYIKIIHPELLPQKGLYYLKKLE